MKKNLLLLCFGLSLSFALSAQGAPLESFDNVIPPALPEGWTSTTNSGSLWTTTSTSPDSSPNSAFVNGATGSSDTKLVSPTFLLTGGVRVQFRHRFNLENIFDGGVLDLVFLGTTLDADAAGNFAQGGYTAALGGNNALNGRQAWTGNSLTYVPVQLDIGNFGITPLQLIFRRVTDASVASPGWNVDTIDILGTDVEVTTKTTPAIVIAGQPFSVETRVRHIGPNETSVTTNNATLIQLIPNGYNFQGGTASQGTVNFSGRTVSANIGALNVGQEAIINTEFQPVGSTVSSAIVTINSPGVIAGDFLAAPAEFGPTLPSGGLTGAVVLVTDGVGPVNDGCEAPTNAGALNGNIALMVNTGACSYNLAVKNAQSVGAVGAIVQVASDIPSTMVANGIDVTIPSVQVGNRDGNLFTAAEKTGALTATLTSAPTRTLISTRIIGTIHDVNFPNNFTRIAILQDSDSDGTPDELDNCPNNNIKTSPGACGCGAADVDTNQNSILDCFLNDELRARLNKAKGLIGKVAISSSKQQKKTRKNLKSLIADISSYVTTNLSGLTIKTGTTTADKLNSTFKSASNKLLAASGSTLTSRRNSAKKAVNKFVAAL